MLDCGKDIMAVDAAVVVEGLVCAVDFVVVIVCIGLEVCVRLVSGEDVIAVDELTAGVVGV